jgi:hypothetical protein
MYSPSLSLVNSTSPYPTRYHIYLVATGLTTNEWVQRLSAQAYSSSSSSSLHQEGEEQKESDANQGAEGSREGEGVAETISPERDNHDINSYHDRVGHDKEAPVHRNRPFIVEEDGFMYRIDAWLRSTLGLCSFYSIRILSKFCTCEPLPESNLIALRSVLTEEEFIRTFPPLFP